MAKRIGKTNITVIILASVILAIVGLFAVAATFAADNWLYVELPFTAGASTDTLTAAVDPTDKSVVKVTYEKNAGEYHFSAFDLVVYTEGSKAPLIKNVAIEAAESTTMDVFFADSVITAAYAYPFAEQKTASDGNVETVSYGNVFVKDFFELQSVNNEKNANPADAIAADGAYKNVFVTGDFAVDKPLTFTRPCSLHLLKATVTLKADLRIEHTYGGLYGIDAAGGNIVQDGGALTVTTPNAFFGIADGVVKNADGTTADTTVVCSQTALPADEATTLADNMLESAAAYIAAALPERLTHNIALPRTYGASGVEYAYNITDGGAYLTADGVISRVSETKTVVIEVTATYKGIYAAKIGAARQKSVTLYRSVVGTGATASADELAALAGETLEKSLTLNVDNKYIPNGDVELGKVFASFRTFGFDLSSLPSVSLSVDEQSGSSLIVGGARQAVYNISTGTDKDEVRLAFARRIANGAALTVTAACGNEKTVKKYTLAGMTAEEVTEYLETLVYTPEFATTDSSYGYIGLLGGELYRGADSVSSSLGVTAADVKAVALTDTELAELKKDPQGYAGSKWSTWATDTRKFTVTPLETGNGSPTGGTIKAKTLASGEKYVVLQKFTVDPDLSQTTDATVDYYTYRVALVPEAGVGGNETTQYIAGNTFADFYEKLDNGRLLESESYAFAVDSTGVGIYVQIEGDESIGDYCYFVYKNAVGKPVPVEVSDLGSYAAEEYYIYVDIEKFPERNASAKAIIYFYYAQQIEQFKAYANGGFIDDPNDQKYDALAAASCFTTQSYGFTLPGIYRVGAAFDSDALYNHILNAKNESGGYIYDAYRKNPAANGSFNYADKNYLYVDGAGAVCASLDCTSLRGEESVNVKGIELLTGTSGFVFDGVKLSGFESAFAAVNTQIKTLSMRDCGLTADILGSRLTNCQGLTTVDLSDNGGLGLASLGGLVYRTVTSLKIAGCGLTAIAGIGTLPNLTEVDLSRNTIKYFGELTSLTKLKKVNVAGNTVAGNTVEDNITLGTGVAYGTTGEVNIPVYVYLLNVNETEIRIRAASDGDDGILRVGKDIAYAQQIASLILTGVEYDRTVTSTAFEKNVEWGETTYTVKADRTVGVDFKEKTDFASGDNFYFLVAVTYGDTTCYALYEATFAGGAA